MINIRCIDLQTILLKNKTIGFFFRKEYVVGMYQGSFLLNLQLIFVLFDPKTSPTSLFGLQDFFHMSLKVQ